MLAIADSGSTKCDWVFWDKGMSKPVKITSAGLNPSISSIAGLKEILSSTSQLQPYKSLVKELRFFGAGCGTKKNQKRINKVLKSYFTEADVLSDEDTMAAVMATTNDPAVVCILGTGSNCCYFDGKKLHKKTPALGYLLMDEGSGNWYGKELLKAYYHHTMPKYLRSVFEKQYDLREKTVLEHLYQIDSPNQYLATFAKFLFENQNYDFVNSLLYKGVSIFIDVHVMKYNETLKHAPIHFVGSIAYYAQDYIRKALNERGIEAGRFVKSPIDQVVSRKFKEKN